MDGAVSNSSSPASDTGQFPTGYNTNFPLSRISAPDMTALTNIETITKCVAEVEKRRAREKPHQCTLCSKRYVNSAGLIVHMLTHRDQSKPYACATCKLSFPSQQALQQHDVVHRTQHENQCNICFKSFSYKSGLVHHMQEHDEGREFICGICQKVFSTRANLNSHILSHSYEEKMRILSSVSTDNGSGESSGNLLKNGITREYLDGSSSMNTGPLLSPTMYHTLSNSFFNYCANNFQAQKMPTSTPSQNNFNNSNQIGESETHIDVENDINDKMETNSQKLLPSLGSETEINQFNDTSKGRLFNSNDDKSRLSIPNRFHLFGNMNQSNTSNVFQSSQSGSQVSSTSQFQHWIKDQLQEQSSTSLLSSNMNSIWPKTRDIHDLDEQKKLLMSDFLDTGEKKDERERPYPCDLCGKRFIQKGHLQVHRLCHTGEKPHACHICNRRFSQKSGLEQHILTHTGDRPHACPLCDKTFTQKSGLNNHLLSHSGERKFACRLCGRRFKQKANLQTHVLTHTGEKPHHCTLCDKRFTQKGGLIQHLQQQHASLAEGLVSKRRPSSDVVFPTPSSSGAALPPPPQSCASPIVSSSYNPMPTVRIEGDVNTMSHSLHQQIHAQQRLQTSPPMMN